MRTHRAFDKSRRETTALMSEESPVKGPTYPRRFFFLRPCLQVLSSFVTPAEIVTSLTSPPDTLRQPQEMTWHHLLSELRHAYTIF